MGRTPESPILQGGAANADYTKGIRIRRRRGNLLKSKPPSVLNEEEATKTSTIPLDGEQDKGITAATAAKEEEGGILASTDEDLQQQTQHMTQQQQQQQQKEEEEEMNDPVALSRREWLRQCSLLVGGGVVAGSALMGHQKQQQEALQKQQRKPFIRLEPYPHRQKQQKQPNQKQSQPTTTTTTTTTTATTATVSNATTSSVYNRNATSSAISTKNTNATTTTTGTKAKSGTSNATTTTTTKPKPKPGNATSTSSNKELAPVNFTKVASENSINITLKSCDGGCVQINATSFQKVQTPTRKLPWFVPKFLQPTPKVLRDIPDQEVLLAATVAGSVIEMFRTTLLYPLATVKTRIQTRQQKQLKVKLQRSTRRKRINMAAFQGNESSSILRLSKNTTTSTTARENSSTNNAAISSSSSPSPTTKTKPATANVKKNARQLKRRLRVLQLNIQRHVGEGNLYAGLVPSLLVSVPATGVYYGVRDVTKRMLVMATPELGLNDAAITLVGAFVADVVSLMVRTPADALATRLQAVAAAAASQKKTTSSSARGDGKILVLAKRNNATTTTESRTAASDGIGPGASNVSAAQEMEQLESVVEDTAARTFMGEKANATIVEREPMTLVEDGAHETPPEGANNNSTMSSMDLALEALFREEQEHYRQKETTLVLNTINATESLAFAVLPPDSDHYLLMKLQCQEINLQDLYGGVGSDEQNDDDDTTTTVLTDKQIKRRQRQARKAQRKNNKRIAKCEAKNAKLLWGTETPQHLYTQEFLEGLKADGTWGRNAASSSATNNNMTTMMNPTIVTDWDVPLWNLVDIVREQMTLLQQQAAAKKNETAMNNATILAVDEDMDSIRMPEKEERELLKELQEESIYQEDWFRQSLQRLPAIIITDLPYLLSRIALNRIIIHGTVNIGQYEVATIGIAVVCALITTPFDVVRTRLLVENNDKDIAPCDTTAFTELANANTTTTTADGSIILINSNATTVAVPENDSANDPDYLSQGVLRTMICIAKEGDGGVRNLYAGWLERTLYFGIGRAWIDPINIITYIGIRDTLLLKLFD